MSKPAKPAAAAPAADAGDKPKSKKKMMIIIVVAVLVLALAGGGAFFFLKKNKAADQEKVEEPAAVAETGKYLFIPLAPQFTVNLQHEEGDRYLQTEITLRIPEDPHLADEIKGKMPEIRSRLNLLLSGKKPSEITTVEGKKELITEIGAEITSVLHDEPVPAKDAHGTEGGHGGEESPITVLFTSFIVQ